MSYEDIVLGTAANSKIIEVMLRDSTTGQAKASVAYGSVAYSFIREGDNANRGSGTCVTMTKDTYADHGWVETDIAGVYQFGVPQAALATGKNAVTIKLVVSGAIDVCKRILIMGQDLRAAAIAANMTQVLGTAAHTPTVAGVPVVEIHDTSAVPAVTLANSASHGGAAAVITLATPINANVASQANIDFGALQKASITAAVPTAAACGTDAAAKVLSDPTKKLVTDANGYVTYSNAAPPTAAACGTDAASKVLVTPAQKLVTDGSGYVTYANAAPPAASAIKTEIEASGSHLALIKADTNKLAGLVETATHDRFKAEALETAPGGGSGGDATAANQTTILGHLTDIKGAGFSGSTDALEKLADAVAAITPGTPINVTRTTQIITRES